VVLPVPKDAEPVSLVPPVAELVAVGGVTAVLLVAESPDTVVPPLESPPVFPESVLDVDCVAVLTELVVLAVVVPPTPADNPVLVDCCAPTALSDPPACEFA
jgi:hypothetical protein